MHLTAAQGKWLYEVRINHTFPVFTVYLILIVALSSRFTVKLDPSTDQSKVKVQDGTRNLFKC